MEIQKLERAELQLKEHSTDLIAIVTDPEKSRDFERGLTIQKVVKSSLPIAEMQRHVGARDVAVALDIQLTRLVGSLNLKWNLNDSQIKTIVEDLIDKYKNESIEDFILVFKKARQGEYGELYRLDSAVIFGWVEKYLEEKYVILEDELRKEKDILYQPVEKTKGYDPDQHQKWLDKLKEVCNHGRKVPGVSDEEIITNGQSKPPKRKGLTSGWKYFDVRGVQIYAVTQEHAEELAEKMIKQGILEEDK